MSVLLHLAWLIFLGCSALVPMLICFVVIYLKYTYILYFSVFCETWLFICSCMTTPEYDPFNSSPVGTSRLTPPVFSHLPNPPALLSAAFFSLGSLVYLREACTPSILKMYPSRDRVKHVVRLKVCFWLYGQFFSLTWLLYSAGTLVWQFVDEILTLLKWNRLFCDVSVDVLTSQISKFS
jgi:hypothetical protein